MKIAHRQMLEHDYFIIKVIVEDNYICYVCYVMCFFCLQTLMNAETNLVVLILVKLVLICLEHLDVSVKMATSKYRMGTVKICIVPVFSSNT